MKVDFVAEAVSHDCVLQGPFNCGAVFKMLFLKNNCNVF